MPFVCEKFSISRPQSAFLFLIRELGYTQKEAQRFIAKGRLLVDGIPMKKPSAIIENEVEFIYFKPISRGLKPVFENEHFVVFDKPSGMLVHPLNRYTSYSLIDELKSQFGNDANITHRIDQETSGLVLCAKNKQSERDIKMMFEKRDMQKTYLAVVRGKVEQGIVIDEPLLTTKSIDAAIRTIVKVDKEGKPSKTTIEPLKYFAANDTTLVKCYPHTGRQHQIRVHLFHVKHCIVGDPLYGQTNENVLKYLDRKLTKEERLKNTKASRLMLHASELRFKLYEKEYHIKSDFDLLLLQ